MKNRIVFFRIVLIILVCPLILSGCGDDEWDIAAEFFEVWAEENGLVSNGELNVGAGAEKIAKDVYDNITNLPDSRQLDGLDVIGTIEEAEVLSNEALEQHDPEKMKEAIALRPNDWILHEKAAAMYGGFQDQSAAQDAILQSDTLLKESLTVYDDCMAARRAQLEIRLENLWNEIKRQEANAPDDYKAERLRESYYATRQELQDMNEFHETPFCE